MQGLAKLKQLIKADTMAHKLAASALEAGDRLSTFAEIKAQGIELEMPAVKIDRLIGEGDTIKVGGKERTRKTEFGDWMESPGDKAIFTSKGTLMLAGKARLITVAVNAMADDSQDREKAVELAERVLEQL